MGECFLWLSSLTGNRIMRVQANSKVSFLHHWVQQSSEGPNKTQGSAARKGCLWIPESGRQLKTFKSREVKP